MPVYNEEACVIGVIQKWVQLLSRLRVSFQLIVLNDGSTDRTEAMLGRFGLDHRIKIINKCNSGHGPTILMGYREAFQVAEWVFQCDSDDEIKPHHFPDFWRMRNEFDAILGVRTGRRQSFVRRFITFCSRLTVYLFFGKSVKDVNVPYRLIRSNMLRQIVKQIPPDAFAPNVIVSGALARANVRICNCSVPHTNRTTGTVSIIKWRLWKGALRSFWETLVCRPKIEITE